MVSWAFLAWNRQEKTRRVQEKLQIDKQKTRKKQVIQVPYETKRESSANYSGKSEGEGRVQEAKEERGDIWLR